MIQLDKKKLKVINSDFPILQADNFIKKNNCVQIVREMRRINNYDDYVMSGRNRLNKGSEKFKNFLSNSKQSRKLYNFFNNKIFLNKIKKIFQSKFNHLNFKILKKDLKFSKTNYGLQKGRTFTKKRYKKPTVNLDIDFSVSEKGYFREIHRDRDTRILNFLIYLNTLPKKNGGILEIYSLGRKQYNVRKQLSRFPSKRVLRKSKTFKTQAGRAIFFLSQPNSYHGVSKLISNKKRFFIYGSLSLDRKVKWI